MTLDDLKLTVARIAGAGVGGTAFLISATRALTCAHCVTDAAGNVAEAVNLYFSTWDDERERHAQVEAVDRHRDVALLRFARPTPVPACPRAENAANGSQWHSFGHPAPRGNKGIAIRGTVVDKNSFTEKRSVTAIQLECPYARDSLHGASGSPVLVDGRIVGMISNQPKKWGKPDVRGNREAEPAFGTLFAIPMAQVAGSTALSGMADFTIEKEADAMNATAPVCESELLRRYRDIVQSTPKLSSVKVPGSRAIETIPLESIYVEPAVGGLGSIDDIWDRQRVAVLGEEGMGKAAFLKYLNLRLLSAPEPDDRKRLWPLYVELDRYAKQPPETDLLGFALNDLLPNAENGPLRAHLQACCDEGRLVLLCDGLENVRSEYEHVIDALSRQRRFVVAVRGGGRTDVGQESGATLRLQPFQARHINAFIGKWARSVASPSAPLEEKKLIVHLAEHSALQELARTPRFLALICAIASSGGSLVPTRTALISTAWEAVWDATFGNESFTRRRAVAKALESLARKAFDRSRWNSREFDEEELFDALEAADEREADAVATKLVESEIITPGDGSSYAHRTFRFSVAAFQDYLAASNIAQDKEFRQALACLQIDTRWTGILPMVGGILGRNEKRLPNLLAFLDELAKTRTGEAFGLHACLVAECLAEVNPELLARLAPVLERTAHELLRFWREQPFSRRQIFGSLQRLQPACVRSSFMQTVTDPSSPVDERAGAALGLGAFRDLDTLALLSEMATRDASAPVRSAACLALLLRDPEEVVATLVQALRDPDVSVRWIAVRGIAGAAARQLAQAVLLSWLESPALDQQAPDLARFLDAVGWALVLLWVRPEATLPVLLDAISRGQGPQRQYAIAVLIENGARAAVWPAIRILQDADAEDSDRQLAAQLLTRLGTEAGFLALQEALDRDDVAAKQGALQGFLTREMWRMGTAPHLLEPADVTFSWARMRQLEAEMLEAQFSAIREVLQSPVERTGTVAVLSEARAALGRVGPQGEPSQRTPDLLFQLSSVFDFQDGTLSRVCAFEVIQALDPDPQLLVDALFDSDGRIALRAAAWIRASSCELPAETLLAQVDAVPPESAPIAQGAVVYALTRPAYLPLLLDRYRAGSRTASHVLWLLCMQFGARVYEDGRIELPDGRIETDPAVAAERLRQFDAASERAGTDSDAQAEQVREAARREFIAACDARPQDAAGWASRAVIVSLLGDAKSAAASLDHAIELEPHSPLWHRFRASLYFDEQAYDEAAHECAQAVELGDTSAATFELLGHAYLELDRMEHAVEAYLQSLSRLREDQRRSYAQALRCLQSSSYAEAVEHLDAILSQDAEDFRAAKLRAHANAALGQHEKTFRDLRMIDAHNGGRLLQPAHPQLWESYLARARHHLTQGERDQAFTDAKRVIIANPLHPHARVLRARVWTEKGNPDFAIFDLVALMERFTSAQERAAFSDAVDELVQLSGVEEPAELSTRQRCDLLGVRGVLLLHLGAVERARSDLEQAIGGGCTDWQMQNCLAWLYADVFEVNLERATELAQGALDSIADSDLGALGGALVKDEDRANVWDTLGWAYYKRGMHDEARHALEQAASLWPDGTLISEHRQAVDNTGQAGHG